MSLSDALKIPLEIAFEHNVLFGIELIDAVTNQRVSQGITVTAQGLRGTPYVTRSGFFVWRKEPAESPIEIAIDPGRRPFQRIESRSVDWNDLNKSRPIESIQLSPKIEYPFEAGVTGLIGTVVRENEPVIGARVRLQWFSSNSAWIDSPVESKTDRNGDFAAVLRTQSNVPSSETGEPEFEEDTPDLIKTRLVVREGDSSHEFTNSIPFGRMTRPTPSKPQVFSLEQ